MELTKEIQIGENRYLISRFSAREGSWVVGQFLGANLLSRLGGEEKEITEKDLALALSLTSRLLPEDVYASVQSKCFAACKRYVKQGDTEVAMPLFQADGRDIYGFSLLEVTALTAAILAFNLHCFFEKGAAQTLLTVFPDLSSQSAPGSTPTS